MRIEVHRCDVCRARLRYGILGYRHAFALEQPRGTRVEVVDTCLSAYCMASAARVAEGRIS